MYIKEISGEEFLKVKDEFVIIDVRTDEEFKGGHVEGAINIPYDEILEHVDEIDKEKPVVIYCRTNQRSEFAALALTGAGYAHVFMAPGVELFDYELVK